MTNIKVNFDLRKSAHVMAYLTSIIDLIVPEFLMALYAIDRYSISETGFPIIGGVYYNSLFGPVHKDIFDVLVNDLSEDCGVSNFIYIDDNGIVRTTIIKSKFGKLSDFDIQIIEFVASKIIPKGPLSYKKSLFGIVEYLPETIGPRGEITIGEILVNSQACNKDNCAFIVEEIQFQRYLDDIFDRLNKSFGEFFERCE